MTTCPSSPGEEEYEGYRYDPQVCDSREIDWFAKRERDHPHLPSWYLKAHNQRCLDHLCRIRRDPRWWLKDEKRKR